MTMVSDLQYPLVTYSTTASISISIYQTPRWITFPMTPDTNLLKFLVKSPLCLEVTLNDDFNPLAAKVFNLNFHPLKVVSR